MNSRVWKDKFWDVWKALSPVMDSILDDQENPLIADFTRLEYTGKELLGLTTGTKRDHLFKVLARPQAG